LAERLEYDQLHHFIAAGVWDAALVETELLVQADTAAAMPALPKIDWQRAAA
jgi:hypothetical protein